MRKICNLPIDEKLGKLVGHSNSAIFGALIYKEARGHLTRAEDVKRIYHVSEA